MSELTTYPRLGEDCWSRGLQSARFWLVAGWRVVHRNELTLGKQRLTRRKRVNSSINPIHREACMSSRSTQIPTTQTNSPRIRINTKTIHAGRPEGGRKKNLNSLVPTPPSKIILSTELITPSSITAHKRAQDIQKSKRYSNRRQRDTCCHQAA